MENEDITKLKEYVESILYVVKHEAEEKISKSIVAHFLESMVRHLDQICHKNEVWGRKTSKNTH